MFRLIYKYSENNKKSLTSFNSLWMAAAVDKQGNETSKWENNVGRVLPTQSWVSLLENF